VLEAPDIISGQVHVLPAERGQMNRQVIRDILIFEQVTLVDASGEKCVTLQVEHLAVAVG
jgi:hypothetical protein